MRKVRFSHYRYQLEAQFFTPSPLHSPESFRCDNGYPFFLCNLQFVSQLWKVFHKRPEHNLK
ncbi:hypothetical protein YC2023_034930 [Brassica napus]